MAFSADLNRHVDLLVYRGDKHYGILMSLLRYHQKYVYIVHPGYMAYVNIYDHF